jgi:hypothetical protein
VRAHERGVVDIAGEDAAEDLQVLGDGRADAGVGRKGVDAQDADAVVEVAEHGLSHVVAAGAGELAVEALVGMDEVGPVPRSRGAPRRARAST